MSLNSKLGSGVTKCVNVIRGNDEFIEVVALAIEELKCAFNESFNFGYVENSASHIPHQATPASGAESVHNSPHAAQRCVAQDLIAAIVVALLATGSISPEAMNRLSET